MSFGQEVAATYGDRLLSLWSFAASCVAGAGLPRFCVSTPCLSLWPLPFGQRELPAVHQISLLPATGGRSSPIYSIELRRQLAVAFRGGTLVALKHP